MVDAGPDILDGTKDIYYRVAKVLSRMGESAKRFPTREAIQSKGGKTSCEGGREPAN